MPYKVDWLCKDRVILAMTWGNMVAEHVYATSAEIHDLLVTADGPVCLWADLRYVSRYLPDIHEIAALTNAIQHPNLKHLILITGDPTLHFFGRVIMKIGRRGFNSAHSPQTGLAMLGQACRDAGAPSAEQYELLIQDWLKGDALYC